MHLSVKEHQIPIALYRGVWSKIGQGAGGNMRPYVYTCPASNSRLEKCDSLFVLSIAHPEIFAADPNTNNKPRRGKSVLPSKSIVHQLQVDHWKRSVHKEETLVRSLNGPQFDDLMLLLQNINLKMEQMDTRLKELDKGQQEPNRSNSSMSDTTP
jgi:hypothetical protein